MTAWVKCPSCGARNELLVDRLYCNRCQSKLDLSKVRFGKGATNVIRLFLKRLLRVTVLVILLAVLVLLIWPTTPEGAPGTEADGQACFDKMADLYEAIGEGRPLQRIFREAEINGYFDTLLADAPASGRGLNVRSINLSFTETAFVVHIRAEWKVLKLSYEVAGQPQLRGGRFDVDVERVSLGHLPVPGPLKQRFAGRLMPLFEQMERERHVLDHLSSIELGSQRARLITGR